MEFIISTGALALVLLVGWVTPGPNMFAVMAASLEHGRKHGLATGAGLALGAFIWAALAVLGVAILFELFPAAIVTLKLIGAAYLIWLGIKSFRNVNKPEEVAVSNQVPVRPIRKSLVIGLSVSMTNPKAALFFSSIMTAFIPETSTGGFLIWIVIFCGFFSVILHSVTAIVFSTRIALHFFTEFRKQISALFGIVFIALGGSIAYAVLRRS